MTTTKSARQSRPTKSDMIASLDDFTTAYIECALWSSTDESRDDGGDPMDQNYGPENLTIATLKEMISDCQAFQSANEADLQGLDVVQIVYHSPE